ncbi:tetratricopeptide repeat protein [Myxococcota bacterium]
MHAAYRYREMLELFSETMAVVGEEYRVLHGLAQAEGVLGSVASEAHFEQALSLCPASDRQEQAAILTNLAELRSRRGRLQDALALLERAAKLWAELGAVLEVAVTKGQVADILQARGHLDEALRIRLEEQLPVYEQLGAVLEVAVTKGQVADILQARGHLDEALRIRQQEELPVYEQLGAVREVAVTKTKCALVFLERQQAGDRARAKRFLKEALEQARALRIPEATTIQSILDQLG